MKRLVVLGVMGVGAWSYVYVDWLYVWEQVQWWVYCIFFASVGFLVASALLRVSLTTVRRRGIERAEKRRVEEKSRLPPQPYVAAHPIGSTWYGQQPSTTGGYVPGEKPKAMYVDLDASKFETEV